MQQHAMGAQLNLQCAELLDAPSRWRGQAGGRGEDRGQSRGEDRGEGAQSQRSRLDNCILSVLACTL